MKKLMLGCGVLRSICAVGMMAFAVTAEAVTIDGFRYELDTQRKTAKLTGYEGSPTKVDVGEGIFCKEARRELGTLI